jgi:hypothetical protein
MPLEHICIDIGKEINSMMKSQDAINRTLEVSLQGVQANSYYAPGGPGAAGGPAGAPGAAHGGGAGSAAGNGAPRALPVYSSGVPAVVHSSVEDWHL